MKRFRLLVEKHIPSSSERLRVAVLDTGIDISHPDFDDENRLKEQRSWVGGAATVDQSGHGTHIVSTILWLTRNVDVYVAKVSDSNVIEAADNVAEVRRWQEHPTGGRTKLIFSVLLLA
jgi:hypothetical protein